MNLYISEVEIIWLAMGIIVGALLMALFLLSKNNKLKTDTVYWETKFNQLQEQLDLKLNEIDSYKDELRHLDDNKDRLDKERIRLIAENELQKSNNLRLETTWQESRQLLQEQFNVLAKKISEENREQFLQTNKFSLDALLTPLKEQIHTFRQRVDTVHQQSVYDQAVLQTQIKNMLDVGSSMSQEADNLSKALKGNKKVLGNWGEVQLEQSLQQVGLVKDQHYASQVRYTNDKGEVLIPDFVLYLPDQKQMVLDSKVSLVAYAKAVEASDDQERQQYLEEHCKAIKTHIKQLADKNYPHLNGITSPGFVLMFLPIEAAYIEALKFDVALFDYAYNQQVVLVSHTTLMPVLKTVGNLWNQQRSQQYVSEVSDQAAEIYNQVAVVAQHLQKLGNSLNTSVKSYNDALTSLKGKRGLLGKVQNFTQLSTKANKTIPELNEIAQTTTMTNDFAE